VKNSICVAAMNGSVSVSEPDEKRECEAKTAMKINLKQVEIS